MKAYKYRIYPTESQRSLLARTFGSCRFVWNNLLGINKEQHKLFLTTKRQDDKPKSNFTDLSRTLTSLKQNTDFNWLYEVSSIALQQKAKDLALAFTNGFKISNRQGMPKFKSKNCKQSFRIVGKPNFKDGKLYLPKDNRHMRIRMTRPLPREVSSYTVSKTTDGKYWISFTLVEGDNDRTLTNGQGTIGIDLGLKDLVIDSNGTRYGNPRWYRRSHDQLTKAQAVLSRRKKGSSRRTKARLKVAKIHAKIRNQREDYLHKLSRQLINENQVIGMEDLMIEGMVKNGKLSKSIMDAGWGIFRQMLTYKASESGHAKLVFLDRWYPSTQTCSHCKRKREVKADLTVREWTCEFCNVLHDRDINAASNIEHVARIVSETYPEHNVVKWNDYKDARLIFNLPATPVQAQ